MLDHLDQQRLRDDTIVIYLAENNWKQGKGNPPHDGKRSPYEGGPRTPILVRWPVHIKPGVANEPVMSVDLAATLLRGAGLSPIGQMQGVNLVDLLEGKRGPPRQHLWCRVLTRPAGPKRRRNERPSGKKVREAMH